MALLFVLVLTFFSDALAFMSLHLIDAFNRYQLVLSRARRNGFQRRIIQVGIGITYSVRQQSSPPRVALTITCPSIKEKVEEVDLIQFFGLLAETSDEAVWRRWRGPVLLRWLLWRKSFEILQSSKPSWIPTYRLLMKSQSTQY
jgi:hypothetical protein